MSFFNRRKPDGEQDRRGVILIKSAEAPRLRFSQAAIDRANREWAENAAKRAAALEAARRAS